MDGSGDLEEERFGAECLVLLIPVLLIAAQLTLLALCQDYAIRIPIRPRVYYTRGVAEVVNYRTSWDSWLSSTMVLLSGLTGLSVVFAVLCMTEGFLEIVAPPIVLLVCVFAIAVSWPSHAGVKNLQERYTWQDDLRVAPRHCRTLLTTSFYIRRKLLQRLASGTLDRIAGSNLAYLIVTTVLAVSKLVANPFHQQIMARISDLWDLSATPLAIGAMFRSRRRAARDNLRGRRSARTTGTVRASRFGRRRMGGHPRGAKRRSEDGQS